MEVLAIITVCCGEDSHISTILQLGPCFGGRLGDRAAKRPGALSGASSGAGPTGNGATKALIEMTSRSSIGIAAKEEGQP